MQGRQAQARSPLLPAADGSRGVSSGSPCELAESRCCWLGLSLRLERGQELVLGNNAVTVGVSRVEIGGDHRKRLCFSLGQLPGTTGVQLVEDRSNVDRLVPPPAAELPGSAPAACKAAMALERMRRWREERAKAMALANFMKPLYEDSAEIKGVDVSSADRCSSPRNVASWRQRSTGARLPIA